MEVSMEAMLEEILHETQGMNNTNDSSQATSSPASSTNDSKVIVADEPEVTVKEVHETDASPFLLSDMSDMHHAVELGDLGKLQELYRDGGLLTDVDYKQESLLHVACRHLWYDVIHFLVCKEIDTNFKCALNGQTPLHYAIQSPFLKVRGLACIKLLLTFGADPSCMDKANLKPRDYLAAATTDDNNKEVYEILNLLVTAEQYKSNQSGGYDMRRPADDVIQKAVADALHGIRYDVDDNKILIQDLKSSVITLKVATSRLESEGKELSNSVSQMSKDKVKLENSLVDLEFRFNELITKEDSGTGADINNNNRSVSNQGATCGEPVEDEIESIKTGVISLESRMQNLTAGIARSDHHYELIERITTSLRHHEKSLKDVQTTLSYHEKELIKIEELEKLAEWNQHDERPRVHVAGNDGPAVDYQAQINMCSTRTLELEKSVATAWVGLVAALLLIPIAYIMGRFF